MKPPNDGMREKILDEARKAFEKYGFLKASMRDIAHGAGISTGNIYNYFKGKDELFRAVVRPATYSLHVMLEQHHGLEFASVCDMLTEEYFRHTTDEYLTLIHSHRTLLGILFFKAQGSSLERFKEEFTDKATAQVKLWIDKEKSAHCDMNAVVTDFFLHLNTVWMFSFFEEIIMHDIRGEYLEQVVSEYIKFEISGWKCMFNL